MMNTKDIQGNTQYQYSIMRAQIQGYQWFFSELDKREFDLIRETHDTKLFQPSYNGKFFIAFPVDHNNKLVQFFPKRKERQRNLQSQWMSWTTNPSFTIHRPLNGRLIIHLLFRKYPRRRRCYYHKINQELKTEASCQNTAIKAGIFTVA